MRSLRSCLLDEPLPKLMAMADAWDAAIEATSIKDAAESLATFLLQADHLDRAREALPHDSREALNALLSNNGKTPIATFERRFGHIRAMGPGRLERERPWLSPENAAETLWYRGFIFRAFDKTSGTPVEVFFIPTEMLSALRATSDERTNDKSFESSILQSPFHPPSTFNFQLSHLLDDTVSILCHIQNVEIKVRPDGVWDALSRKGLARTMHDADGVEDFHVNKRFVFLLHLIERLGWTRVVEGKLKLIPQPVTGWLQKQPDEQRVVLFEAWKQSEAWNDLAHVEGIALEMTHAWRNDPIIARAAVIDTWRKFESENRASIIDRLPSFVIYLRETNPDFARRDGRYDTWHIRDLHTGEFLHGFENWDRIEGALIRYIVEKPLIWLEEISLNSSPTHPLNLSTTHPFTLSSDSTITLMPHLRYERFQLSRVADFVELKDGAYVHRLTPRSMKRANEQGISASRVVDFLEKNNEKPLPASVRKAVERWRERGAEVRVESVVLLRTKDAATMDILLKLESVKRAVVERIAANCVSIRAREARTVQSAIAQNGTLVDVIEVKHSG
jgi:hypothetical protein